MGGGGKSTGRKQEKQGLEKEKQEESEVMEQDLENIFTCSR